MKLYGHDHKIEFDCIPNHDVYAFLKIRMEVPRGQDTKAILILNGKEIGEIVVDRRDKHNSLYAAYRYMEPGNRSMQMIIKSDFKELGRAMAAIITDLVR